jgi:purine-nucleoside phosphorylase
MTPHIEAKPGDYHPIVLMPGDPLRAKWIAENFLDTCNLVNQVRNCLGYSGTYKGKPISIQASGMGQPSLGIYAHELYNFYGVETIIRVGSCGGISNKVKVGDIVVALTASTDSKMTGNLAHGFSISPCCDYNLLKNFVDICPESHVGSMVSNDYFYQPYTNWHLPLSTMGILAVDMETHLLYTLAMANDKKALSVNTVSDHLLGGEEMSSKERETGLSEMVENVLESLL